MKDRFFNNCSFIGLTGPMGTGKTTFAQEITILARESYNFQPYYVEIIPFASTLKMMLAFTDLHSVDVIMRASSNFHELSDALINQTNQRKNQPLMNNVSMRKAAQTLGTEWGREIIDPDIWVELWYQMVELRIAEIQRQRHYDNGHIIFIADDIRFPNEINVTRTFPFSLIFKLERDPTQLSIAFPIIQEAIQKESEQHASEAQFNQIALDRSLKLWDTDNHIEGVAHNRAFAFEILEQIRLTNENRNQKSLATAENSDAN